MQKSGNRLPRGRTQQLIIKYQMVDVENIHRCNIILIKYIILRDIFVYKYKYIYIYMHIITINEEIKKP